MFGRNSFVYLDLTSIATPRLVSIGAPNSNDAAFVLLGGLGMVVYQLFNRFRFVDLVISMVAFFGMLFTWTRSVWIFLLIYFLIIFALKKTNLFVVLFFGLFAFAIGIYAFQLFEKRKLHEDRLQTNENAVYRENQMIDYLVAIPEMHFFWGVFDDTQTVKSKLHIRGEFSSENYTLETFTKHGILAGSAFVLFFIYFILSFWRTTNTYINVQQENKNDFVFVGHISDFYSMPKTRHGQ